MTAKAPHSPVKVGMTKIVSATAKKACSNTKNAVRLRKRRGLGKVPSERNRNDEKLFQDEQAAVRACYVVCQGPNPDVKSIFRPDPALGNPIFTPTQGVVGNLLFRRYACCHRPFTVD